jgi:hypothetical protein
MLFQCSAAPIRAFLIDTSSMPADDATTTVFTGSSPDPLGQPTND